MLEFSVSHRVAGVIPMKIIHSLLCGLVLLSALPRIFATTGPYSSKDETVFFTTKIHRFGEPVKVVDTTDQPGGSVTISSDSLGQRSIRIERITMGKSPLAPAAKGKIDEAYLKSAMQRVRDQQYAAAKLKLGATKQEKLIDANGTPCLVVVDELAKSAGGTVIRGFLVFATEKSLVLVQYDSNGMEYAGSKRYDLCDDMLQWIAKNLKVQDPA